MKKPSKRVVQLVPTCLVVLTACFPPPQPLQQAASDPFEEKGRGEQLSPAKTVTMVPTLTLASETPAEQHHGVIAASIEIGTLELAPRSSVYLLDMVHPKGGWFVRNSGNSQEPVLLYHTRMLWRKRDIVDIRLSLKNVGASVVSLAGAIGTLREEGRDELLGDTRVTEPEVRFQTDVATSSDAASESGAAAFGLGAGAAESDGYGSSSVGVGAGAAYGRGHGSSSAKVVVRDVGDQRRRVPGETLDFHFRVPTHRLHEGKTLRLDALDVPIEVTNLGVVTKKMNFSWLLRVAVEKHDFEAPVTTEETAIPTRPGFSGAPDDRPATLMVNDSEKAAAARPIADDFIGYWSGGALQYDTGKSWRMFLHLTDNTARMEYPTLGCSADLELVAQDEHRLIFLEKVTAGRCGNGGTVELSFSRADSLMYFRYFWQGKELSRGTLGAQF